MFAIFFLKQTCDKDHVNSGTPQALLDLRSTPQALLDLRPVMADRTSVRVGVLSRQVMGGSEGRESRKEVSEVFLLFRRVLKCSAHRERIPSRSLMSNVPQLSFT